MQEYEDGVGSFILLRGECHAGYIAKMSLLRTDSKRTEQLRCEPCLWMNHHTNETW